MKISAITFLLLGFFITANAQQNYDASLIAKDLLPYAKAVVRNEQVNIEVKDLNNTIYHIKRVVTILNKNADNLAEVNVWYNDSEHIKNINGIVYDAFGKATGKFSESDFEDDNTEDGFSLFQDVKVKHYQPSVTSYPYTIEYEYEVRSKQSLNFEDWEPNSETGIAVENSSYTFACKPGFNIRYKESNMPSGVTTGTDKNGLKTYTWQVSNLKAVKSEPYSPLSENYLSSVKIAPENFEYEGIKGSFTNWNELGKWTYDNLLMNRQGILPGTIQYIQQLTTGITDPKLKARKIYEYMQSRTHYVSVQIGIGGYQPFLAADVDRLNYGDCKALVNYTQGLLKVDGINSWYCVVEAGDDKVGLLNDFASMNQGNHIILCIPFKNDTTWADCTNQTIPFGYLGDFTDDRTVLACTPDGGKILHTPKYTAEDNLQQRKAAFNINETGELSGGMTTLFKGIYYTNREGTIRETPHDQIKSIQNIYSGINNMQIGQYNYQQDKGLNPVTTENIKLKAPEFAAVNDNKIVFLPNAVNRVYQDNVPRQVHNRVNNVYVNDGYTENDEISYTMPAGYRLFTIPLNVSVKKPFGSFTATIKIEGDKLVYTRNLQLIDGTYPKASYQDLVDLFQSAADADEYEATLVKGN